MEEFRLYKYIFTEGHHQERDWTQPAVSGQVGSTDGQEVFEKILKEAFLADRRLPIGKEPETGRKVLPNSILRSTDRVTLLKLHNPGVVDIWELNGAKISRDSFPYSYIIIDNRPGIGQLAIQKKTDAWSDPDVIARLLQDNLNRILKDQGMGLQIEIRHKYLPSAFFEYLKKRRKEGAFVKHITFEFTNPQFETPIDTAVDTTGHIRQLMLMLTQLGGAKARLRVDAPERKELIKRKLKDIKQMVSLVATNGYKLNVEFSDKEKYECDEKIMHDDEMEENTLSNFRDGLRDNFFEFELFKWLDKMLKKEKEDNYHEQPIRVKPARKSKRKVS